MRSDNWLRHATTQLAEVGIESARLDALILLEDAIGKDRTWLLAHPEHSIDKPTRKMLDEFLSRRTGREPLAYVRGKTEFYGREYMVTPDVLIPRPESEAIVDQLVELAMTENINTVIDVGTGSGCLAISAKLTLLDTRVIGIDISPAALRVAQQNAQLHNAHIQWQQLDVLIDELPSILQPYVIIANLPYVPEGLVTSPEIAQEPTLALFSGQDGLDHYRVLFERTSRQPHQPRAIITESLETQHDVLADVAGHCGFRLYKTHDLIQIFKPTSL